MALLTWHQSVELAGSCGPRTLTDEDLPPPRAELPTLETDDQSWPSVTACLGSIQLTRSTTLRPSGPSTCVSATSDSSPAVPTSGTCGPTTHFARYRDDPFTPFIERDPVVDDVDVVIVGGGIAGVLAGAQLRKAGVERIRIVDQAGGIGGTWYWNRYPGVMCDVESYIYLPMLEELDYVPTRRYAYGEEILHHLETIADRFDLVARRACSTPG